MGEQLHWQVIGHDDGQRPEVDVGAHVVRKTLELARCRAERRTIEAPEIAENGAVVPIEITSNVPGTTSIAVLIDKNPFPLVGKFDFMEGALPFVKLHAKVGETSDVRVIAEAGGRHYVATQEIKVTIGGCGG